MISLIYMHIVSLQLGVSTGVRLVIDAEYTYLNPALRFFSLAMMLAYNTSLPLVAYTYQNYLKVNLPLFDPHILSFKFLSFLHLYHLKTAQNYKSLTVFLFTVMILNCLSVKYVISSA